MRSTIRRANALVVRQRLRARPSLVCIAITVVVTVAAACVRVGDASVGDPREDVPGGGRSTAPAVIESIRPAESVRPSPARTAAAIPEVDAEPTRVVVRDLRIDLPVIRAPRDEAYPLCDVAEFLPAYGLPGLPGVTYIYAHAQAGMFLSLLEASRNMDGAELLGTNVDVYTADAYRRRYAITEVHRHVRSFDVVNDLRGDGLVLQTSETDHQTGTKLMIVARPVGGAEPVSVTKARPEARPRVCGA
jgi:hypothetical protein